MVTKFIERPAETPAPSFEDAKAANRRRVRQEALENAASIHDIPRPFAGRIAEPISSWSRPVELQHASQPKEEDVDPVMDTAAPEQAFAEQSASGQEADIQVTTEVTEDAAMLTAKRYADAMSKRSTPPPLRQLIAAVIELRRHRSNGQTAQLFGHGYATGAAWVSQMAGLRRISEDVWPIIETAMRQREPKLFWLAKVSQRSPVDQLRIVTDWANE